jgi:hypothetical protein
MKSLASGEQDYVGIQVRKADTCILHVQGEGNKTNRSYGVAGNIKSGEAFASWIAGLDAQYSSLAGTGKQYVGAQVARRGDNLHIQVLAKPIFQGVGKRNYGAVLDIPISDFPALAEFIDINQDDEFEDDFEDDGDEDCCHSCCH